MDGPRAPYSQSHNQSLSLPFCITFLNGSFYFRRTKQELLPDFLSSHGDRATESLLRAFKMFNSMVATRVK